VKASDPAQDEPLKILLMGDSGAGKTGSLASLAIAKYNVRIVDFDNGCAIFRDPSILPPEFRSYLEWETCTDKYKTIGGRIFPDTATAWLRASKLLGSWGDYGNVSGWTSRDVLVIDSTTFAGRAAMNFHLSINARLAIPPDWKDYRFAQDHIANLLMLLYSDSIKCNVICISHVDYHAPPGSTREEREKQEIFRGYPTAVGAALGPKMGRNFNAVLLARTEGNTRSIWTSSRDSIELKTTAPSKIKPVYPLSTGLADYFAAVKASALPAVKPPGLMPTLAIT
jgi:hypothetical protein